MNVSYYAIPGLNLQTRRKFASAEERAKDIVSYISLIKQLSISQLKEKNRKREIVYARQLCMFFIKEKTSMYLTGIGKLFGKDHTTVIHAVQTIKDLVYSDPRVRTEIDELRNRL